MKKKTARKATKVPAKKKSRATRKITKKLIPRAKAKKAPIAIAKKQARAKAQRRIMPARKPAQKKQAYGRKLEEEAKRNAYDSVEMAKSTEQLNMRYALPAGLEKELEDMSWETVANLANTFKLKIESENIELRRLEKEIELTRLIILERIGHHQKTGVFDYKFFVDLVKLLERCERLAIQHEVDLEEFMTFVYVLIEKMKKEKLVIYSAGEKRFRKRSDRDNGAFCRIKENDSGAGLP